MVTMLVRTAVDGHDVISQRRRMQSFAPQPAPARSLQGPCNQPVAARSLDISLSQRQIGARNWLLNVRRHARQCLDACNGGTPQPEDHLEIGSWASFRIRRYLKPSRCRT